MVFIGQSICVMNEPVELLTVFPQQDLRDTFPQSLNVGLMSADRLKQSWASPEKFL